MAKKKTFKKVVVFFDFDNTITTFDILDDMLIKFSRNDDWLALEKKWKQGKIGSKECLKGQVEGISITRSALDKYLTSVKIDPYFKKLIGLLESKKIKMFILSDNFEYILKKVLKNNKMSKLNIYANRLNISGDRLTPVFPLTNARCGDCAHCKKTTLLKNTAIGSQSVYIGDGRSDVCVSNTADLVFAKGYLKSYLRKKRLSHIPFNGLKSVYGYFQKRSLI